MVPWRDSWESAIIKILPVIGLTFVIVKHWDMIWLFNDVMPIASELERSAILLTYEVNSLKLSDAYIHQQTRSSLIKVMTFNLFGAKPLPKPMLAYCQLESYEQTVVKFDCNLSNFIEEKKMSPEKRQPFCLHESIWNLEVVVLPSCRWVWSFQGPDSI